jgi:tRNA pseudouridine38-40 synthase
VERFLAVLEYDGTAFQGSQVQAGCRTVQGELEKALARLDGQPVKTVFAGRTDTGVHACGQVVAFDLRRPMTGDEVRDALCGLLPRDASVREAAPAPADFNPRYWAQARRYRYRMLLRPCRSALWDRFALHVPYRLDVDRMRQVASQFLGRHDFRCFGRPPQGEGTERTLYRLDVECAGDLLAVVVEGDAFLRRMVRRIVGTLIDVGRGKTSLEAARLTVEALECSAAGVAVPAKGLTLEGVAYDRARLGQGAGRWWSCEPLVLAV